VALGSRKGVEWLQDQVIGIEMVPNQKEAAARHIDDEQEATYAGHRYGDSQVEVDHSDWFVIGQLKGVRQVSGTVGQRIFVVVEIEGGVFVPVYLSGGSAWVRVIKPTVTDGDIVLL